MKDDWKGEHLIRATPSKEARAQERQRLISVAWHKKRRKEGAPTPAASGHARFTRSLFGDMARGEV